MKRKKRSGRVHSAKHSNRAESSRTAKRPVRKNREWTMGDFVDSVWKTMEEQAEKNNALKMLHAKLEPEWNKVVQTVSQMLEASGENEVTKYIEEICGYGEKAVRPLIEIVLKLKSAVNMMEKKR